MSEKRIGTREEVYKGIASRTAGGLKRDDIIAKQFGTRILYISKKLSDIMRNNPNNFQKRNLRRTLVNTTIELDTNKRKHISSSNMISRTQKLSFKIKDNTVKNVFYPELQGLNIKQLKDELAREEAEEDLGQLSVKKEFTIEEMPEIDILDLA